MTSCIEYDGCKDRDGYGRKTVNRFTWYAHRYAWTMENGEIPPGVSVRHRCDNPPCINVDHLFLGTQLEDWD